MSKEELIDYLLKAFIHTRNTGLEINPFTFVSKKMLESGVKEGIKISQGGLEDLEILEEDFDPKVFDLYPIFCNFYSNNSIIKGYIQCFGYNITVSNLDYNKVSSLSENEFLSSLEIAGTSNMVPSFPHN